MLTAGEVKVTMNPRIRLMPPQGLVDENSDPHSSSYNLEIQNVRVSDAGDYACQLGTIVPKEIVHSLEVLGMYAPDSDPTQQTKTQTHTHPGPPPPAHHTMWASILNG